MAIETLIKTLFEYNGSLYSWTKGVYERGVEPEGGEDPDEDDPKPIGVTKADFQVLLGIMETYQQKLKDLHYK